MLRRTSALAVAGLSALASLAVLAPAASPVQAVQPAPGHSRLVPESVRTNVPRITTGEITDLEYIGNRVFVAGTFSSIRNNAPGNTTTYAQPFLASYNIDTGLVDTAFRPTFGGGGVTEIEASPDGTRLYVVGRFNTVNGVTKRKVAALNAANGAVITGFTAHANAAATSVDATGSTVYIGGQFTTINGAARVGLAAVNANTGAVVTGFVNNLSGGIGVSGSLTVQELVLTHDDAKLMVVHTARQIAGQDRYGVGFIDTQTNQLLPWRTRLWDDNLQFVGGIQRIYAGAISPDDSYFVVTSGSGGDRPPINDTAIAFTLDGGDHAQPRWISRLFDSVYSVAISEVAVYLGGHFNYMESPSSTVPWPGLDNVGYGQGQGLAGYGLGDEIVIRDHIGAIDPATGTALEWNPGSNSFEGNKAMLVTPRGLFTGGDATTQGGQNVGRVAFYDLNTVAAPGQNETTIVNPIEGRVKEAGVQFVVDGTATATSGIRRVQVEVFDRDAKRYLQDDLVTWGPANTIVATLAAPNATSSTWSLPLTITGNRRIQVLAKTYALNNTNDPTKASKKFETFGLADQTPATGISSPAGGTIIPTTTFIVTGTATDDVGVNAITFTFRDAQNRYLQDDGTADNGFNSFRGVPDVLGATSATWSYEVTVPYESEWTMQATVIDTAGQSDLRSADRTWLVSATAMAPSVAITTPAIVNPPTATAPITVTPGSPITFSGSATDDQGLRNVEITLRNSTTRENLAADGSWGTDVVQGWYRISEPFNVDGSSLNWTYTTPFALRPGTYSFNVRATDDLGLTTSNTNLGRLTVNAQAPGDLFPDSTLSLTGTQTAVQVLQLDLAGGATDDFGVSAVGVTVREQDSGRYIQSDGTLSAAYSFFSATLASPNATSTSWSISVGLPAAGDYAVTAFSIDTAGQQDPSSTGATARYLVYPGETAPVITENLLAPTEGTAFTESRIFVSGRMEDDVAMARAQVSIRNSAGQFMTSAGAFTTTTETWITAFLNSPGTPGSNFSYTTPAIPSGAYRISVRGIDSHDLITPVPSVRNVTVSAPAGNLAPVAGFTVSCSQNVCTFDGRSSTDENAPTLTYAWNFGSGTGSGPVPTRTYSSAATYTVTLTVKDEYGLTGTATQTVTITEPTGNVAPTPVINPPSCAALVCNISGVGSADSNVGDTITYLWDFGDGTPTSTASAMSHTFPAPGTYVVTLTTTDGWGKFASITRNVTVA